MDYDLGNNLVRLLAVALLVFANGFFVAAEFALVSVRRTRIAELLEQGQTSARWVKKAIDDPDRFIAATQLGITLASLGLGWIGEPAFSNLIDPLVEMFPADIETQVSHSISAGLSFAVITFLHVVVGELAPKSIALQSAERTSLVVARPIVWTERIFKPIIWALNGTGNALLRWVGVKPASGHELVHSVEELKMLVSASAESGVVQDGAEEMLHAIFDFGQTLVRHVMVPRTEMVAVPQDIGLESLLELATEQPYSKFPVYSDNLDQILGIVHLKDLLQAATMPVNAPHTAEEIMREAIYVPETARISTLLSLFRSRQQHIAIVLDEYGGTAGVVTLSDLLEEIVGEVNDPFADEPDILALPDGSSLVDGLTPIDEVNEHFNLMLSDPHYDTLAGFILGKLERLAQVGDKVIVDGVRFQVEAMDGLRIARISLSPWPPTPTPINPTDDE